MGWIHQYLGAAVGQPNVSPEMARLLQALADGNAAHETAIGNLTVEGILYNDTYWRDHLVSLAAINPVGPATAPTADPDGEGFLFAGVSTDNVAVFSTQINHDSQQGTVTIKPHLHWRKTTDADGDVVWKLEAKYAAPGGKFGNFAAIGDPVKTPIAATVDDDKLATHLITSFGDYELTVALSTIVVFKLTSVASDTVNDTYAADALAMSFDFHYPVDSPGSADEYSKGF